MDSWDVSEMQRGSAAVLHSLSLHIQRSAVRPSHWLSPRLAVPGYPTGAAWHQHIWQQIIWILIGNYQEIGNLPGLIWQPLI